MGNLTVKQIEASRPKDKPYKLIDGDGLQLRIATDGIKSWLVRYMINGKERQYRLPELYGDGDGRIGLKEAREAATKVRSEARKGVDIQVELDNQHKAALARKATDAAKAKTLRNLFDDWVKTVCADDHLTQASDFNCPRAKRLKSLHRAGVTTNAMGQRKSAVWVKSVSAPTSDCFRRN